MPFRPNTRSVYKGVYLKKVEWDSGIKWGILNNKKELMVIVETYPIARRYLKENIEFWVEFKRTDPKTLIFEHFCGSTAKII